MATHPLLSPNFLDPHFQYPQRVVVDGNHFWRGEADEHPHFQYPQRVVVDGNPPYLLQLKVNLAAFSTLSGS